MNFCFFPLGRPAGCLLLNSSALIRGEDIIPTQSYYYIRDDLFSTQILHKSLDNIFYKIQSICFSPVFWNFLRLKRGPNFQGWGGKPILQNTWIAWIEGAWFLGSNQALLKNSWIIWSPLLYFDFKTFKDPNSSSFIRFPCVLYDSEDFFVRLLKFLQIKECWPNFWMEPIFQKDWII